MSNDNIKGFNENEKEAMQQEINALRDQVSSLLQLFNNQSAKTSTSLDEEVTIIFNMCGALRVSFPSWSLKLTEFGERVVITKAQLQELVNNKRGYFKKQYILLDSKHVKLAELLRVSVYDSSSGKFIHPEDIDKFATMSTHEIEAYYESLSDPMKQTFVNYFYDKCCACAPGFYTAEVMNTLNRLTKSRIFDNLIASCTRNTINY